MYYELASPTITTLTSADYYELETETCGKIINEYDVNDFGTEEFLFGSNTAVPALELAILYLVKNLNCLKKKK